MHKYPRNLLVRLQSVSYTAQNMNKSFLMVSVRNTFVRQCIFTDYKKWRRIIWDDCSGGSIQRIKNVKTRSYADLLRKFRKSSKTRRGYKYQAFHVLLLSVSLGSDWVFLKCRLRECQRMQVSDKKLRNFWQMHWDDGLFALEKHSLASIVIY